MHWFLFHYTSGKEVIFPPLNPPADMCKWFVLEVIWTYSKLIGVLSVIVCFLKSTYFFFVCLIILLFFLIKQDKQLTVEKTTIQNLFVSTVMDTVHILYIAFPCSPPKILILLLSLIPRTSHLNDNLVFLQMCAFLNLWELCFLLLCLGFIRSESFLPMHQLYFFPCASFIDILPGSLSICFDVWLPSCLPYFTENGFFFFY